MSNVARQRAFRSIRCPVCTAGPSAHTAYLRKRFGRFDYRLVRCECSMVFVNPQPAAAFIASLYSDAYFSSANNVVMGYADYFGTERPRRMELARRRFTAVCEVLGREVDPAILQSHGVMDVGCAAGYFLQAAHTSGWRTLGIEPCRTARDIAQREFGLEVAPGPLPTVSVPATGFALVTMFDVLEHTIDPVETILQAGRFLMPGGFLCIECPNIDSKVARLQGDAFWLYKLEHLFYFDPITIGRLLTRCGFATFDLSTAVGSSSDPARRLGIVDEGSSLRVIAQKNISG